MDLIREVLDSQLVDRHGGKMGRVDGLVMELRDGLPPRLVCIETGPPALARRLSRRWGERVTAGRHRRGVRPSGPFRIAWSAVRQVGITVQVEVDQDVTPGADWERWLRRHVIARVPGGGA